MTLFFWRVWSSGVVMMMDILLLLGLASVPLEYYVVVEALYNWYLLGINAFSLSTKN
jgi:hypothetical protein